jgi:hypothetical protein
MELLVTIAVMAVGFLGLLAAFSTTELAVGSTSANAQLASQARQVEDYIESESLAYVACEASDGHDYRTALQAAIASGQLKLPSGYLVAVKKVAQATGGNHTVGGVNSPIPPINGCTTAVGPDYGVQQITFQVSTVQHLLSRIVYKRWN